MLPFDAANILNGQVVGTAIVTVRGSNKPNMKLGSRDSLKTRMKPHCVCGVNTNGYSSISLGYPAGALILNCEQQTMHKSENDVTSNGSKEQLRPHGDIQKA